ncbi:MAG: CBS domain-containing protein [Candidatus Moduliflexus flocculans]|nr:CBS domain-containing protein [Candidatus Moduliflexus flocculans]
MGRVKRYENGFINKPMVLSPQHKISDIDMIKARYNFSGIPITENGKLNSKLVGIVTNRDIDFEKDRSKALSEVMTKDMLTAKEGIALNRGKQHTQNFEERETPDNRCRG